MVQIEANAGHGRLRCQLLGRLVGSLHRSRGTIQKEDGFSMKLRVKPFHLWLSRYVRPRTVVSAERHECIHKYVALQSLRS